MPHERTNEPTLRELVLAGLGARATTSKEGFEALKSEGKAALGVGMVLRTSVKVRSGAVVVTEGLVSRDEWQLADRVSISAREIVIEPKTAVAPAPESETARDVNERLPELIEAMMPQSVPTPAMVLQARRNSASRAALIEEFGLLTGGQIAEINESAAENRAALASRWKQEGKIFSVTHHGATYYPAFQFAPGGRPQPVVTRVLEALGGGDGWETALWFTAANGYLEAARPVDLLEANPEAVVEAAKKDVEVPY